MPDGRPDLSGILRRLGQLEITSVMIEGGATVNWTALAANVVDKVFLYYAPKILAGTGSIPFAAGPGFHHMNSAAQVRAFASASVWGGFRGGGVFAGSVWGVKSFHHGGHRGTQSTTIAFPPLHASVASCFAGL